MAVPSLHSNLKEKVESDRPGFVVPPSHVTHSHRDSVTLFRPVESGQQCLPALRGAWYARQQSLMVSGLSEVGG